MNYSIKQELIRKGVKPECAEKISDALTGIVTKPGSLKVEHINNKTFVKVRDGGYSIRAVAEEIYNEDNEKFTNVIITFRNRKTFGFVDRKYFMVNAKNPRGLYICTLGESERSREEVKVKFFDKESVKHIKKSVRNTSKKGSKNYLKRHKLLLTTKDLGLTQDSEKTIDVTDKMKHGDKYRVANFIIRNLPSVINFKNEQKTYNSQPRYNTQNYSNRHATPNHFESMKINNQFQNEPQMGGQDDVRIENGIPLKRKR